MAALWLRASRWTEQNAEQGIEVDAVAEVSFDRER